MLLGRRKKPDLKYRENVVTELHNLMALAEVNMKPISKIVLSESAYHEVMLYVNNGDASQGHMRLLFGHPVEMRPDIEVHFDETPSVEADGE